MFCVVLGEHTNSETEDETSTGSDTGDESKSEEKEEIIEKSDEFENEEIEGIEISKSKSPSLKSFEGSPLSGESRR